MYIVTYFIYIYPYHTYLQNLLSYFILKTKIFFKSLKNSFIFIFQLLESSDTIHNSRTMNMMRYMYNMISLTKLAQISSYLFHCISVEIYEEIFMGFVLTKANFKKITRCAWTALIN